MASPNPSGSDRNLGPSRPSGSTSLGKRPAADDHANESKIEDADSKDFQEVLNDWEANRRDRRIPLAPAGQNAPPIPLQNDPIIICIYAEKGGVGKSTTAGTLGGMLGAAGHTTVIYDCDNQRNVTSWLLLRSWNQTYQQFLDVHDANDADPPTLYHQLMHYNDNRTNILPARARLVLQDRTRAPVYVVPGYRSLSEFDENIGLSESLALSTPMQRPNIQQSAAPFHAIMATGRKYGARFIILDLNPNGGTLNRCLVMSSHYLIVPSLSDLFSHEMMEGLQERLRGWYDHIQRVIERSAGLTYPFPSHFPRFLGYVLSAVKPNPKGQFQDGTVLDRLNHSENRWATRIWRAAFALRSFLENLNHNMVVPMHLYRRSFVMLALIREFNQLNSISGLVGVPVPLLQDADLARMPADGVSIPKWSNISGYVLDDNGFLPIYTELVNTILRLTGVVQPPAPAGPALAPPPPGPPGNAPQPPPPPRQAEPAPRIRKRVRQGGSSSSNTSS